MSATRDRVTAHFSRELVGLPALVLADVVPGDQRRGDENEILLRLLSLEQVVSGLDRLGANVEWRLSRRPDEHCVAFQRLFGFRRTIDPRDVNCAVELLGRQIGAHGHLVVD